MTKHEHPRMIRYLLGGWWETCSATKLTLLAEHSGTGPSDTVSWKKNKCKMVHKWQQSSSRVNMVFVKGVLVRWEKRNITPVLAQTQWKTLSPHVGAILLHWEDPSGSKRPLLGLGCMVSLPLNLSSLHGKLKGTTSPLEPCAPEAPAGPQYWWVVWQINSCILCMHIWICDCGTDGITSQIGQGVQRNLHTFLTKTFFLGWTWAGLPVRHNRGVRMKNCTWGKQRWC